MLVITCTYNHIHSYVLLYRKSLTPSGIYPVNQGTIFWVTQLPNFLLFAAMLTVHCGANCAMDYAIICTNVITCVMIT